MGARYSLSTFIRQETAMALQFACGSAVTRRLLIPAFFLTLHVQASELLPTRLYDVTIETGMPHLEDNLRYTTTHQRNCISLKDLATEFPILNHPTLAGCTLGGEARKDDTVKFVLSCDDRHGTTGMAVWHIDKQRIRGRLDVKLGGKNMTFSQTVTAKVVGNCP
jgi:Protein of unknown function (DUF3617)